MRLFAHKHKPFAIILFMKPSVLYNIGGWIGVVAILGSYFLLSLDMIDGQSLIYHGLVLVGSALVAAISLRRRDYQPAALNLVFFSIAVFAIIKISFF